jgi:predicted DNA binding CopG/RHH family protein
MIPKKVEKMSLEQQEAFLLQKLMDLQKKEQVFRRALAKVRGKVKIDVSDWERMDLIEMKGGD